MSSLPFPQLSFLSAFPFSLASRLANGAVLRAVACVRRGSLAGDWLMLGRCHPCLDCRRFVVVVVVRCSSQGVVSSQSGQVSVYFSICLSIYLSTCSASLLCSQHPDLSPIFLFPSISPTAKFVSALTCRPPDFNMGVSLTPPRCCRTVPRHYPSVAFLQPVEPPLFLNFCFRCFPTPG